MKQRGEKKLANARNKCFACRFHYAHLPVPVSHALLVFVHHIPSKVKFREEDRKKKEKKKEKKASSQGYCTTFDEVASGRPYIQV